MVFIKDNWRHLMVGAYSACSTLTNKKKTASSLSPEEWDTTFFLGTKLFPSQKLTLKCVSEQKRTETKLYKKHNLKLNFFS